MGIFDVSIATAYGEGVERAFLRLVREILSATESGWDVLDIANWGAGPDHSLHATSSSQLIPTSPQAYAYCWKEDIQWYPSNTPIMLTRVGLHVPVLLMPALNVDESTTDSEGSATSQGNYYASVEVSNSALIDMNHIYRALDSRAYNQSAMRRSQGKVFLSQLTSTVFVVLNFGEQRSAVYIPKATPCLAILTRMQFIRDTNSLEHATSFSRLKTEGPVTFELECRRAQTPVVAKDQL